MGIGGQYSNESRWYMCVMEYAGMYRGKQCLLGYKREMICDMCEVWVTYTQAQTLAQCATQASGVRWVQCVKAWGRAYKQQEVHGEEHTSNKSARTTASVLPSCSGASSLAAGDPKRG